MGEPLGGSWGNRGPTRILPRIYTLCKNRLGQPSEGMNLKLSKTIEHDIRFTTFHYCYFFLGPKPGFPTVENPANPSNTGAFEAPVFEGFATLAARLRAAAKPITAANALSASPLGTRPQPHPRSPPPPTHKVGHDEPGTPPWAWDPPPWDPPP